LIAHNRFLEGEQSDEPQTILRPCFSIALIGEVHRGMPFQAMG